MSGTDYDAIRRAANVERHAENVRLETARRDEAIRAMRDNGASLREIAEVAGVSHTTVSTICGAA